MTDETSEKTKGWALVADRILETGTFQELDRLFTGLIGMPADAITERRVRRLKKIEEMRAHKAGQLGVSTPRMLPEKVAHAVIVGAATEDDHEMHELWANLLANHDAGNSINIFLVNLLRNLDSKTARVLLFFWERYEAVKSELANESDWGAQLEIGRTTLVTDRELHDSLGAWSIPERIRLSAMGLISFVVTGTQETYYGLDDLGHILCKALVAPK